MLTRIPGPGLHELLTKDAHADPAGRGDFIFTSSAAWYNRGHV
jgi:hypothetical protein